MRSTTRLILPFGTAAALGFGAPGISAQAPRGADRLPAAAVAESLAALQDLDRAVRQSPNDASAWYRRGMIAWALAERDRHEPSVPGLDRTSLGRLADTSLRIAASIEKDNAYYRLMSGRYLLSSGNAITRAAAYPMFESALAAARRTGDPYTLSETAIEAGRVYWRRYDGLANRWSSTGAGEACSPVTGMIGPQEAERMILEMRQCGTPIGDSGDGDYTRAEELFREALEAEPQSERAHRQYAMVLVERRRWAELASLARQRIGAAPWDAWAYLTLGLALHEQRAGTGAVVAAFDSAFTLLAPDESKWLGRFERVVRPDDTLKVQSADPATRFALHRLFWLTANPLWSGDAAQPQLDFLSRVVFAELRWTVDELRVRGAETDRGDVYIRYGRPQVEMSRRASDDASAPVVTTWVYRIGLVFTFAGQPTFATARIAPGDEQAFGDIVRTAPAVWRATKDVAIDSMATQLTRFRSRGDSVELLFAVRPPATAIAGGAEVRGVVRTDYWLLKGGTITIGRDSVVPAADSVVVFRRRVERHNYVYRAEATSPASSRAGRAAASFVAGDDPATGFTMRGFGLSDVLIATRAESGREMPVRWSDLDLMPLVGAADRRTPLALVWETYDLTNDGGTSRYAVKITLQNDVQSARPVAARIVGRVASAVGVISSDDRITLSYDRETNFRSTIVDNIALSLAETPPGNYLLSLEVMDLPTGRKTTRTISLRVR